MRSHRAKYAKGVTLLELILVIAIAAILMLTAAIMSSTYSNKQSVKDAASAADHLFQEARNRAIASTTDLLVRTRYNQEGLNWCLGLTDKPGGCNCRNLTCTVNDNLTVININQFKEDITLTVTHSQNLGRNFLLMAEKDRGRIIPTSKSNFRNSELSPVVYTFTNSSNDSVSLLVNKWGLTRLCSNTVAGYPPC